jgi:YggT family protein
MIAEVVLRATQLLVFGAFVVASVVAGTHWAVKHGHLSPFGAWPRAVRKLGQPLLRPVEQRLYRSGGNPVSAPYALFWVALLGGLALLALVQWLIGLILGLVASAAAGPRWVLVFVVNAVFSILMVAILIRVVASWFGLSPYSKPMRVVHWLTDWLIEPLRRVVPPIGMFDVTPLVAYFILYLVRWLILGWV